VLILEGLDCPNGAIFATGECGPRRGYEWATGSAERLVEFPLMDAWAAGLQKNLNLRPGRDNSGASNSYLRSGEEFVLVDIESFLLITAHQVDVELGYTDFAEAVELFTVVVDGPITQKRRRLRR